MLEFFGKKSDNKISIDKKEYSSMKSDLNYYKDSSNTPFVPEAEGHSFDFYKATQSGIGGYVGATTRPGNPLPYLSTDTGAKVPIYPIPPVRLFEIADFIPDVKTVIDVIQKEMFKNGFTVKPRYNFKCKNCGKEYDKKPLEKLDMFNGTSKKPELKCDICEHMGEDNFDKPNPYQRQLVQDLFDKSVNANYQNIEEIARQYERDLDVVDNAYCLILKNYYLEPAKPNGDGAKLQISEKMTEISEFLRVHPAQIAFIADSDGRLGYDDNRNRVYVCPDFRHRNQKLIDPVCKTCGARALKAIAESNSVFSIGIIQPKKTIYAEGELIWTAGKFTVDMIYGYSPLISIWRKAVALMHMDEYVLKYFDKQRPPRSLLVINSRNFESVKQFWERLRQGARDDPSLPRPLIVENEKGGAKNAVEHIDLVGNLKDLEFIEVRKEFRQAIFASYGFPPFLFGEVAKGGFGGANMQITEANRTIKAYQMLLKRQFFDQITDAMGIYDWEIVINEGEETDELRDEQLLGQKIDNAVKLHKDLGMDVWLDGNGEPQSSQAPNPKFLEAQMTNNMDNRSGDRAASTKPKEEEDTKFQGEVHNKNPSDIGGDAQGSPNSGYSLNNKSNDIIRQGVENGWTQTNISKKITKETGIPTEESLELVKSVFRKVVE